MAGKWREKGSQYFIEFLPRIQTAHVCVSTTASQLTLSSRALLLSDHIYDKEGSQYVLKCWSGDQLIASSYQGLRVVPGEGLHVRFKTHPHETLEEGLCDKLAEYGCKECLLSIKCSFCGSPFVRQNYSFRRVLPLPSDSWEELSTNLFCHCHKDHKHSNDVTITSPGDVKLLPNEGDCLVSDRVILMRTSAVDTSTISSGSKVKELVCTRCQLVVGVDVDGKTWKFLRSKVQVRHCSELDTYSGVTVNQRLLLENYYAVKLQVYSKSNTTFKFLVRDLSKRTYLRVWVLNAMSRIVLSNSLCPSVIDQFTGVNSCEDAVVLKILYKNELVTAQPESITKDEAASSIDVLELSTEECLQLLLLLVDNNRAIPPSQRRAASGYQVGFLRLHS